MGMPGSTVAVLRRLKEKRSPSRSRRRRTGSGGWSGFARNQPAAGEEGEDEASRFMYLLKVFQL